MKEVISHIEVGAVPCPGLSGHMSGAQLRGKVSQIVSLEKLRTVATSGCPVNKKVPTKMSEKAFVRTCNHYRELAEKDRNHKNKFVISTLTGFKSSNRRMCVDCKTGEKVKNEKPFKPPAGITFINLDDIVVRLEVRLKPKKKEVTKIKSKRKKIRLTKEDVVLIRKMHKEGYSVPSLCRLFPVTPSTMYRVVNNESWRSVK